MTQCGQRYQIDVVAGPEVEVLNGYSLFRFDHELNGNNSQCVPHSRGRSLNYQSSYRRNQPLREQKHHR